MTLFTAFLGPAETAGSILEFWGKMAGAVMAVWIVLEKVGKPYLKWRQERFAVMIRAVLKEELELISGQSSDIEGLKMLLLRIIKHQEMIFDDVDDLFVVARDNRDRHDERDALLTEAGFGVKDRRVGAERRQNVDEMCHVDAVVEGMERRQRARRRDLGDVSILDVAGPEASPI